MAFSHPSDDTAPVESERPEAVYYDGSFLHGGQHLSIPQQCVDDQYGLNAIIVIGDRSFPFRRCYPFHIPVLVPEALSGLNHGEPVSQIGTEEVNIMGAVPQDPSPSIAHPMMAGFGGQAPASPSINLTESVEPVGLPVQAGQAWERVQSTGSDEEGAKAGKHWGGRKESKKKRKRRQRRISR